MNLCDREYTLGGKFLKAILLSDLAQDIVVSLLEKYQI